MDWMVAHSIWDLDKLIRIETQIIEACFILFASRVDERSDAIDRTSQAVQDFWIKSSVG